MFRYTKKVLLPLAAGLLPFALSHAQSETVPTFSDPTYVIVGYAPGGASDRAARFVSEQLQDVLDVTVIVENKTGAGGRIDRKSTRLNSSHVAISYAVFCLKKKKYYQNSLLNK